MSESISSRVASTFSLLIPMSVSSSSSKSKLIFLKTGSTSQAWCSQPGVFSPQCPSPVNLHPSYLVSAFRDLSALLLLPDPSHHRPPGASFLLPFLASYLNYTNQLPQVMCSPLQYVVPVTARLVCTRPSSENVSGFFQST